MKKWITPLFALFPIIAFSQDAQEPDSMYVVTECFLNDGYSLQDAITEAGNNDYDGPESVWFRQPVAVPDTPENQFRRIVNWENMAAWTAANAADGTSNESYTCANANRSFITSRQAGNNTATFNSGDATLIAVTTCFLKKGVSISSFFDFIDQNQKAREATGDTTVASVSHMVMGGNPELNTAVGVRRIGKTAEDLAESLDLRWSADLRVPVYADTPAESCQNPMLYKTYRVDR